MGVFMESVMDELVCAWEKGVWTYDRATILGHFTECNTQQKDPFAD
jgi:hypothetical protein